MSNKELAARWRISVDNDLASEKIFNVFRYGGVLSMDNSPFGRSERDLIDFRGYSADSALVKNVTAKDIDFSHAGFTAAWMEGNCFENCLFGMTDFSNASDHGNTFRCCVFVNCNFKLSGIGDKGSRYQNCVFDKCNFQKAVFIRPEFVDTDFLNCRLNGADFNAASFENCKFEGLLENVWFRGTFPSESQLREFGQPKLNKMENVSFENADLRDLTFSNGCDLSTVKIKNNGRYFKYDNWYQRLQFLSKEIESWEDKRQKNEAAKFLKVTMVHAPKQDWEILSLHDWEKFFKDGVVARKIVDCLNSYS